MSSARLVQRGKAGIWYIAAYEGVDAANGKERRRLICLRTSDEQEARRLLLEFQLDQMKSQRLGDNPLLADYLERWLVDDCEHRLAASTYYSYAENCQQKIAPRIGGIRLRDLRPTDLVRLYAEVRSSGGPGGSPLSDRSVRYCHAILHAALKRAVRLGLIASNPADAAAPPVGRKPEQEFLTPAQAAHLLDANEGDPWMDFAAVAVLTGLRRGELLAVHWEDVDLDAATLRVSRARKRLPFRAGVVEGDTKTASSRRTVHLAPETVDTLRRIRAAQAEESLARGMAAPSLVFCHVRHGAWTGWSPDTAGRNIARLYRRAAMPVPVKPLHALRHTQATFLAAAGVHPRVAQRQLGHADVHTTLTAYTHVLDEQERQAADAAASVLRRRRKGTDVREKGAR